MAVKKITNRFDSTCAACGETAWAGEQVFYNPDAEIGNKIKHEKCASIASRECTDTLNDESDKPKTIKGITIWYSDGTVQTIGGKHE